jgi:hypothetical protein
MILSQLHPEHDSELLAIACQWSWDTPRWFREMDATFGEDDFEEYLSESISGGVHLGIFDPELVGVIILSERNPGVFECHLRAPRTANAESLALGGFTIRRRLFADGAKEINAWVASKNRPLIKIVEMMGLKWSGVEMLRGVYRNQIIHWYRFAATKEV